MTMIDGHIDLRAICESAGWHRQSAIDALVAKGLTYRDASAFVDFMFGTVAEIRDCEPEEHLDEEQRERLTMMREEALDEQSD